MQGLNQIRLIQAHQAAESLPLLKEIKEGLFRGCQIVFPPPFES